MILVIAAAACLLSVPLTGGRLGALAALHIRAAWMIFAAVALQVLIVSVASGGSHGLHSAVHLLSYALAAGFVWSNREVPGMLLVALGGALNLAAISANGGVMPAWPTALELAGLEPDEGYSNSAAVSNAKLQALGDVIPIPGPWPIGNVLSVGDVILFAGVIVLLHRTCRSRARPQGAETRTMMSPRP